MKPASKSQNSPCMSYTCVGRARLLGMLTLGSDRSDRISDCEAALQVFVKLVGCELKRFWKLKGTRIQLNPKACKGN